MSRLPDFVVIGAMKAATTTLHEQLAGQDGIFMSTPKEPRFFSDDDRWARGLDWYRSLFEPAARGDRCGESSTHYTKLPTYPRTVERMSDVLGRDVRLVYVMRHPVDRLVSQYVHEWTHRVLDCPIGKSLDRHPELVSYSLYAMQLEPFFEVFGRERVLPVFFDRLRAEPQAELERVCRFVGYGGEPRWDSGLGERNVSSERMRENRARDAIVNLPGLRTLRRRLVPRSVTERVKGAWTMKEPPELAPVEVERLEGVFDEDLARLGAWLGVELSCASFKHVTRDLVPEWTAQAAE